MGKRILWEVCSRSLWIKPLLLSICFQENSCEIAHFVYKLQSEKLRRSISVQIQMSCALGLTSASRLQHSFSAILALLLEFTVCPFAQDKLFLPAHVSQDKQGQVVLLEHLLKLLTLEGLSVIRQ